MYLPKVIPHNHAIPLDHPQGNIDLLKINSSNEYCSFYENVLSSSFAPKITLPTRICDTKSTLSDNVYTNVIDKEHICGILVKPISDHHKSCMMKKITLSQ